MRLSNKLFPPSQRGAERETIGGSQGVRTCYGKPLRPAATINPSSEAPLGFYTAPVRIALRIALTTDHRRSGARNKGGSEVSKTWGRRNLAAIERGAGKRVMHVALEDAGPTWGSGTLPSAYDDELHCRKVHWHLGNQVGLTH